MEKVSIFTPFQKLIFDKIRKSDYFCSNFYFTGGTALSEFYLKHRYSEDLDFFSERKFTDKEINIELTQWAKELGFTYQSQFRDVVYIYILKFRDKSSLKLDFGYYPYKSIEKGLNYKGLIVDSLLDIAVNKLSSTDQRSTVKDFTDLYFLLDKFTIWDLIEGVRIKFRKELEHWILSSDLAYTVKDFDTMPRMIKPLTLKELKKFYKELAVKLGRRVVR